MGTPGDPARHYLPVADWPAPDRALWATVTRRGDILDGAGALASLAPRTLEHYRHSYGRWLTFLRLREKLDPNTSPASRVTPATVAAFVQELRSQVAPLTVAQRIIGLEQVVRAFAPEEDWTWLRAVARRLSNAARPVRDKRSKLRPSDELTATGLRLMAEAEAAVGGSLGRRANLYRDGLMLALLAMRPFRLTNFAGIRLDQHLRRVGSGWTICFAAEETKTRVPLELPFPEELVANLERYLDHWRRILLGKTSSDRLWISSWRTPMSEDSVRYRIRQTTARYFGSAMWPHLFRDCLATHIAVTDPEHVRMATPLLGHRTGRTTQKHYNLAGQRQAASVWHAALLQRRRAAERRLRGRKPCRP